MFFLVKNGLKTLNNPYGLSKITPYHWSSKILKYNRKSILDFFLNINLNAPKRIENKNMNLLISNLLSESISDFRKGSNWKQANMRICLFSV